LSTIYATLSEPINERNPVKTIETLEQYRKALSEHDWWYEYSDNYTEYSDGKENKNRLLAAAKKFDPELTIWAEYKPKRA
jgi:hypothetical protein